MKKPLFYLGCATLGGILLALAFVMEIRSPSRASAASTNGATAVSITESGIEPQVVTVTTGSAVVWTNFTNTTIRLVGGDLKVYLPLVLQNVSGTAIPGSSPQEGNLVTSQEDNWLDTEIAPRDSYTFTFSTAGNYPYHTSGSQVYNGKVVVQDGEMLLFDRVLYMAEDTGAATIDDNASLDLGVGDGEDFTIETFFYVPDLTYDDSFPDLLARKDESFEFYILFNSGQPDWIFFNLRILGLGWIKMGYQSDIPVGWHHVAAVFDNEYTESEDAFSIYLDSVRVAHSPDENIHVDWTPGLPPTSNDLEIGGVRFGRSGFYGYLEEVRISDIVRYGNPTYTVPTVPFSSDPSTLGLWHFDETPGATYFLDASSYGNHLTGYDGAQTYSP